VRKPVLLLYALLSCSCLSARFEAGTPPPLPTPWSCWTEIDAAAVHYVDTAPGENLPVFLLLPGFLGSAEMFLPLAAELAGSLRVVVVDLPGFGWSAPPAGGCTMEDRLAFVRAFIDRLDPGTFVLGGSSLGANIAIRFAISNPSRVRRLVLLSPFGMKRQRGAVRRLERLSLLLPLASRRLGRAALVRELARQVRDPAELTEAIVDNFHRPFRSAGGRRVVAEVARRILLTCHFDDVLCMVPQPTLVLAGSEDVFGSQDIIGDLERGMPDCTAVCLDGCRHFIQLDATAEVAEIILRFCAVDGT
jgi:pimeloyl-ACP methyl ester carboxylesterase